MPNVGIVILHRLNELVDFLLPFYLIVAIGIIALLVVVDKNKQNRNEPVDYTYHKKASAKDSTDSDDWKLKFSGKWIKIERENMYEFLIFNGVSSFLANMAKDKSSENVFTINKVNDDLYTFALVMTGIPPGEIHTCTIGKDSANPGKLDNQVDSKGKVVNISIYAIEETKSIQIELFYVVEEKRVITIRTIREDGLMNMRGDMIKKDGTSQYYTAVYKKA
mmetsp:Transcript_28940/g.39755  ORF Transcript_28940/g.39755 Transcript_28940/m.39755 type:complete len:221 (+) Transcript_28940:62-724(+)